MTVAHVLYVAPVGKGRHDPGGVWSILVGDKVASSDTAVLVADKARALGATHVRFRDKLDGRGRIVCDPSPEVVKLMVGERGQG